MRVPRTCRPRSPAAACIGRKSMWAALRPKLAHVTIPDLHRGGTCRTSGDGLGIGLTPTSDCTLVKGPTVVMLGTAPGTYRRMAFSHQRIDGRLRRLGVP
jgi:hypothetical protein